MERWRLILLAVVRAFPLTRAIATPHASDGSTNKKKGQALSLAFFTEPERSDWILP
jgi:hypothetical protein